MPEYLLTVICLDNPADFESRRFYGAQSLWEYMNHFLVTIPEGMTPTLGMQPFKTAGTVQFKGYDWLTYAAYIQSV